MHSYIFFLGVLSLNSASWCPEVQIDRDGQVLVNEEGNIHHSRLLSAQSYALGQVLPDVLIHSFLNANISLQVL